MAQPQSPPTAPTGPRRGALLSATLLAATVLAILAALPLAGPLFDPTQVALAVDTASVQMPWSAAVGDVQDAEGNPVPRPRNPALSDQGVGFYPFYRWVLASWRTGDPPYWNPLLYLGAPGLGNPQYGVLDPQVLVLWPLEAAFGLDGFHLGLAWLAFLRLFAAGFGAFVLARRLGLGFAGALLAGVVFQSSGYVQLWLNFSLGHVTPFLPWILVGIEGCRGARPGRSAVAVALLLAGAVLGGHPETAFYVGAAAGVWAVGLCARERRAGFLALGALAAGSLLAAPSVLPFVEYLGRSGAQALRAATVVERSVDVVSLGALVAFAGVLVAGAARMGDARLGRGARVGALVLLAFAAGALALLLSRRGLPETAGLALVHDLFGAPGRGGGYQGPGTHVEEASAWIPGAGLALALAAALSSVGALQRRGLVLALGFVAWWLALRAPGLLDLKQQLPVVGLGATVRLASVSGLMLALLAGEALRSAGPLARRGGVVLFVVLALVWCRPTTGVEPGPELATAPESGDWLQFVLHPAADGRGRSPSLEGWVHPDVVFERARARVVPIRASGEDIIDAARPAMQVPAELASGPGPGAREVAAQSAVAIPEGARWFSSRYLQTNRLAPGLWRLDVVLLDGEGGEVGSRRAGVFQVTRPLLPSTATLVLVGAGLGLLLVARCARAGRGAAAARWALVALAAAEGQNFARGLNPAVPLGEAFPMTHTERILAREQGVHRFFSDPGVLPPDTGLVRGLRALDGYDGLDVVDYNALRGFALKPGVQPLLGWNARGVDLDAPVYRMLGVKLLALNAPLDHPRFEAIAGPDSDHPEYAEVHIYRDREPFPRAFVVPEVTTRRDLTARLASGTFDPFVTAALDAPWRPREPLRAARVLEGPHIANSRVELLVELEGDGLLVLTEQAFPGWVVEVDGERRAVETANAVFRSVPLESGRHRVVFLYRPRSFQLGLGLAGLGCALLFLLVRLAASTTTAPTPPNP
ncbi:MAG: YfhO family protein [Planctomycetaceae bacterium]|nr:YfhO family protein [Planctomycetaceae bacterium]